MAVGGGFHVISGSNRLTSTPDIRRFSAICPAGSRSELSYTGIGVSVGSDPPVRVQLRRRASGPVRRPCQYGPRFDPGGHDRPPVHLGLGMRWRLHAQARVAGQSPGSNLVGANSDLLAQGGTGGAEHDRGSRRARNTLAIRSVLTAGRSGSALATPPCRFRSVAGRTGRRVRRLRRKRDAVRPAAGRRGPRAGASLALGGAPTPSAGSSSPSACRSGRERALLCPRPRRYLRHAQTRLHRDLRLPDERGRLRADARACSAATGYVRVERPGGRRRHAGQHLRHPRPRRAAGDRAAR